MACMRRHGNKVKVRFRVNGAELVTTVPYPRDSAAHDELGKRVVIAEQRLRDGEHWSSVRRWIRQDPAYGVPTPAEHDALLAKTRECIRIAKKRATLKGVPFTLRAEDADRLLLDGRCAITGIRFSLEKPPGAMRAPWAPSLDRVTPEAGYTIENARLVCLAVNYAMNQWGQEIIDMLVDAMAKKEGPQAGYKSAVIPQLVEFKWK